MSSSAANSVCAEAVTDEDTERGDGTTTPTLVAMEEEAGDAHNNTMTKIIRNHDRCLHPELLHLIHAEDRAQLETHVQYLVEMGTPEECWRRVQATVSRTSCSHTEAGAGVAPIAIVGSTTPIAMEDHTLIGRLTWGYTAQTASQVWSSRSNVCYQLGMWCKSLRALLGDDDQLKYKLPRHLQYQLTPLLFTWLVDWNFMCSSPEVWAEVATCFVRISACGTAYRPTIHLPWKPLVELITSLLFTENELVFYARSFDNVVSFVGPKIQSVCSTAAHYFDDSALEGLWELCGPKLSHQRESTATVYLALLFNLLPVTCLADPDTNTAVPLAQRLVKCLLVDMFCWQHIRSAWSTYSVKIIATMFMANVGLLNMDAYAEPYFTAVLQSLNLSMGDEVSQLNPQTRTHRIASKHLARFSLFDLAKDEMRWAQACVIYMLPNDTNSPLWNQLRRFVHATRVFLRPDTVARKDAAKVSDLYAAMVSNAHYRLSQQHLHHQRHEPSSSHAAPAEEEDVEEDRHHNRASTHTLCGATSVSGRPTQMPRDDEDEEGNTAAVKMDSDAMYGALQLRPLPEGHRWTQATADAFVELIAQALLPSLYLRTAGMTQTFGLLVSLSPRLMEPHLIKYSAAALEDASSTIHSKVFMMGILRQVLCPTLLCRRTAYNFRTYMARVVLPMTVGWISPSEPTMADLNVQLLFTLCTMMPMHELFDRDVEAEREVAHIFMTKLLDFLSCTSRHAHVAEPLIIILRAMSPEVQQEVVQLIIKEAGHQHDRGTTTHDVLAVAAYVRPAEVIPAVERLTVPVLLDPAAGDSATARADALLRAAYGGAGRAAGLSCAATLVRCVQAQLHFITSPARLPVAMSLLSALVCSLRIPRCTSSTAPSSFTLPGEDGTMSAPWNENNNTDSSTQDEVVEEEASGFLLNGTPSLRAAGFCRSADALLEWDLPTAEHHHLLIATLNALYADALYVIEHIDAVGAPSAAIFAGEGGLRDLVQEATATTTTSLQRGTDAEAVADAASTTSAAVDLSVGGGAAHSESADAYTPMRVARGVAQWLGHLVSMAAPHFSEHEVPLGSMPIACELFCCVDEGTTTTSDENIIIAARSSFNGRRPRGSWRMPRSSLRLSFTKKDIIDVLRCHLLPRFLGPTLDVVETFGPEAAALFDLHHVCGASSSSPSPSSSTSNAAPRHEDPNHTNADAATTTTTTTTTTTEELRDTKGLLIVARMLLRLLNTAHNPLPISDFDAHLRRSFYFSVMFPVQMHRLKWLPATYWSFVANRSAQPFISTSVEPLPLSVLSDAMNVAHLLSFTHDRAVAAMCRDVLLHLQLLDPRLRALIIDRHLNCTAQLAKMWLAHKASADPQQAAAFTRAIFPEDGASEPPVPPTSTAEEDATWMMEEMDDEEDEDDDDARHHQTPPPPPPLPTQVDGGATDTADDVTGEVSMRSASGMLQSALKIASLALACHPTSLALATRAVRMVAYLPDDLSRTRRGTSHHSLTDLTSLFRNVQFGSRHELWSFVEEVLRLAVVFSATSPLRATKYLRIATALFYPCRSYQPSCEVLQALRRLSCSSFPHLQRRAVELLNACLWCFRPPKEEVAIWMRQEPMMEELVDAATQQNDDDHRHQRHRALVLRRFQRRYRLLQQQFPFISLRKGSKVWMEAYLIVPGHVDAQRILDAEREEAAHDEDDDGATMPLYPPPDMVRRRYKHCAVSLLDPLVRSPEEVEHTTATTTSSSPTTIHARKVLRELSGVEDLMRCVGATRGDGEAVVVLDVGVDLTPELRAVLEESWPWRLLRCRQEDGKSVFHPLSTCWSSLAHAVGVSESVRIFLWMAEVATSTLHAKCEAADGRADSNDLIREFSAILELVTSLLNLTMEPHEAERAAVLQSFLRLVELSLLPVVPLHCAGTLSAAFTQFTDVLCVAEVSQLISCLLHNLHTRADDTRIMTLLASLISLYADEMSGALLMDLCAAVRHNGRDFLHAETSVKRRVTATVLHSILNLSKDDGRIIAANAHNVELTSALMQELQDKVRTSLARLDRASGNANTFPAAPTNNSTHTSACTSMEGGVALHTPSESHWMPTPTLSSASPTTVLLSPTTAAAVAPSSCVGTSPALTHHTQSLATAIIEPFALEVQANPSPPRTHPTRTTTPSPSPPHDGGVVRPSAEELARMKVFALCWSRPPVVLFERDAIAVVELLISLLDVALPEVDDLCSIATVSLVRTSFCRLPKARIHAQLDFFCGVLLGEHGQLGRTMRAKTAVASALRVLTFVNLHRIGKYVMMQRISAAAVACMAHGDGRVRAEGRLLLAVLTKVASTAQMQALLQGVELELREISRRLGSTAELMMSMEEQRRCTSPASATTPTGVHPTSSITTTSTDKRRRVALVLALCAAVLADPGTIPPYTPRLMERLAGMISDPHSDEIRRAVSKTLNQWWSAHRRGWELEYRHCFTAAQLQILTPLFSAPSYYA